MRRAPRLLAVAILAALVGMALVPAATANNDDEWIVVENGRTQPVFDYAAAIREVVYVEAPMDSDGDGANDLIAMDVIRPAETEDGMKVPSIMEASPYYGRSYNPAPNGTKGFPGWWDEYFVPRGYAIVQPEMQGTGRSFGCPVTGGVEDTISIKAVVDWLQGNAPGYYYNGDPAVADWSSGFVGMQGVSYVGTLPNAVATQGVPGLRTVVPIAAISSWYKYVQDQGIGWQGWLTMGGRYTVFLANYVQEGRDLPGAVSQPLCTDQITEMGNIEASNVPAHDFTPFWQERSYIPDARQVKNRTSVFFVHGLTDFNVKTMHTADLWEVINQRDMARKIWIHRGAHVNPTSFRNTEWVEVMHKWMDYWLYRINNGVMDEPMLDIQRPDGSWETHDSWPDADAEAVELHFGPASADAAGTLNLAAAGGDPTQAFTDLVQTQVNKVGNAHEARPNRLVYVTEPLEQDVRISGTPQLSVKMETTAETALLSAILVDYGQSETVTVTGLEPLELIDVSMKECDLEDIENQTGCATPEEVTVEITPQRQLAHGHIDAKNYKDLRYPSPIVPGNVYTVNWKTLPSDHIVPAGNRIGIVITGNYTANPSQLTPTRDTAAYGSQITVHLNGSKLILPVVGGADVLPFD